MALITIIFECLTIFNGFYPAITPKGVEALGTGYIERHSQGQTGNLWLSQELNQGFLSPSLVLYPLDHPSPLQIQFSQPHPHQNMF